MSKRQINFMLEPLRFSREVRSEVMYKSRCLFNYLTRKYRASKHKDPGYSGIVIVGDTLLENSYELNSDKVLSVHVKFDFDEFNRLSDEGAQEYFIECLKTAIKYADTKFSLPTSEIYSWVDEFILNKYSNKWVGKKKLDRTTNVKAELLFDLQIDKFIATLKVMDLATKSERVLPVLETKPDEFHYDFKLKDLIIDGPVIKVVDRVGKTTFETDIRK